MSSSPPLLAALALAVVVLAAGCSSAEDEPASSPSPTTSPTAGPTASPTTSPTASPTTSPTDTVPSGSPTETASAGPSAPPPRADPDDVRVRTAIASVRHLAERVGPRPGTTAAYRRAASWVQRRFAQLGWQVDQQSFRVPGGTSVAGPTEGLPVAAGRSANVVATRGDLRPGEPWLVVGAHLDTVPTSPGAEDNASGVGVLLAVAEAVAQRRTRLPVVLVAFGAEEPRGPTDDDHHYGSRHYVAGLGAAERRSLRGMLALDRVGVGDVMPVGSAGEVDPALQRVLAAARRAGVPTVTTTYQRSSDHWSFVRAGLPGSRLGSTPYAGYHSPQDTADVVDPRQLLRAARVTVAWLR